MVSKTATVRLPLIEGLWVIKRTTVYRVRQSLKRYEPLRVELEVQHEPLQYYSPPLISGVFGSSVSRRALTLLKHLKMEDELSVQRG